MQQIKAFLAARWFLIAALAVVISVLFIRLRLASAALERDEGEYAYMGQQILNGVLPYKEAGNMKFPGTYFSYAAIEAVFGQTASGIRYGLLLVNFLTALLVYRFCRVFGMGFPVGLMAAMVYLASSLSISFLGLFGHATHFVVFYGMSGLVLLLTYSRNRSAGMLFVAGVLVGLAYMAKQSGFYFTLFGGLLLLMENSFSRVAKLRCLVFYCLGAFTPFAVTVFVFNRLGCLDEFIFWTFKYARFYGTPLNYAWLALWLNMKSIFAGGGGGIYLTAGLLGVFIKIKDKSGLPSRFSFKLLCFLILAGAGVSLGFVFRNHYWLQILPPVAVLSALFFNAMAETLANKWSILGEKEGGLAIGVCSLVCLGGLAVEYKNFIVRTPGGVVREVYRGNPFNEMVYIAKYINTNSPISDRVFVFGNEPEIYFYTKRKAVGPFLYTYPLFENQPYAIGMQRVMVQAVEDSAPRYFLQTHLDGFRDEVEGELYIWMASYLAEKYEPLFMIDLYAEGDRIVAGRDVKKYKSDSGRYIVLWQKKGSGASDEQ